MNERIKQLALQSQKVIWSADGNVTELTDLDIEKFAELIIDECARVARSTPCPYFDEHMKQQLGHTWDMAAWEAGHEIVKHFGVEK